MNGVPTPSSARNVVLASDALYVANWAAGLRILDASNRLAPFATGSLDVPGLTWDVAVSGNVAVLASGAAGLHVLDVSDPFLPSLLGSLDTPGEAQAVVTDGTYAFLADAGSGLQVIDISDRENPASAATLATAGVMHSVALAGDRLFIVDDVTGLTVLDVSDPTSPVPLGSVELAGTLWAIAIAGDLAFVAGGSEGLHIVDVSNEATPQRIGGLPLSGPVVGVTVDGTCAYVSGFLEGVHVVDVENPELPDLTWTVPVPGASRGVAVGGSMAYVAAHVDGVQVIDWGEGSSLYNVCPVAEIATQGESEVAVPIIFAGPEIEMGAFGFDLGFDDSVLSISEVIPAGFAAEFQFFDSSVLPSGDVVRVGAFHSGLVTASNPDTLCYVVFDVGAAVGGSTVLTVTNVQGIDAPGCDGTLTYEAFQPVPAPEGPRPSTFLSRATPNPSRGEVVIEFELPGPAPRPVEVSIHDVAGRRVARVLQERLPAGRHRAIWSGADRSGAAVAAGVYFYCIRSGARQESGRIVRMRTRR